MPIPAPDLAATFPPALTAGRTAALSAAMHAAAVQAAYRPRELSTPRVLGQVEPVAPAALDLVHPAVSRRSRDPWGRGEQVDIYV